MAMLLHTHPRAPNPRRLNLFIAYKGIELPTREVDMLNKETTRPEYLAKNPRGLVPALDLDDGSTLCDALAIAIYLEEKFPQKPLFGKTPEERAHIISWDQYQFDGGFLAVFEIIRNSMPQFESRAMTGALAVPQIPALAERGKLRLPAFLSDVDKQLGGRDYLVGGQLSWADISLYTTVDFAIAVKMPIPDDAGNLRTWFARVKGELAPLQG
jgi:glutathione S-transferase